MKQFLVPTDFSDYAQVATQAALAIAAKNNAAIDFLHCMDLPRFLHSSMANALTIPEEYQKERGLAQQQLNNLSIEASHLKLNAKNYLSFNAATEEITAHAQAHHADLIIMGSHGSSGIKEAFLGTNTQRVLRTSKAPVLVLKQLPQTFDFKNIVFAATFKEDVHAPFRKVIDFAQIFGAQIHLLYVNMPYNFEETSFSVARMQAFEKMYPGMNLKLHIYNAFDEENGILDFAHANNIDVIATTTHGKSGFVQMLSPSITESLANHSSLPVLSINIKG